MVLSFGGKIAFHTVQYVHRPRKRHYIGILRFTMLGINFNLVLTQSYINQCSSDDLFGRNQKRDGSASKAAFATSCCITGPSTFVAANISFLSNHIESTNSFSSIFNGCKSSAVALNAIMQLCGKGHGWDPMYLTDPSSIRMTVSSKVSLATATSNISPISTKPA